MRGKRTQVCAMEIWERITPAHAGKTHCKAEMGKEWQDHPRPCGENFLHPGNLFVIGGSPPPMRGKLKKPQMDDFANRITPAHAGKTLPTKKFR